MKSFLLLLSAIVVLLTVIVGVGILYLSKTSEASRTAETPPASSQSR